MSKATDQLTNGAAPKAPTMKSAAKLAGVSVQTVSVVINNDARISDETSARVRSAIKQLGYRPYSIARSLRTRTITLVVSDIANPVFPAQPKIAPMSAATRHRTTVDRAPLDWAT